MRPGRRLLGDRSIVTRLVVSVALAMGLVLLAAGAFVFWRVEFALDRQLDRDLAAYRQVVDRAVARGQRPPLHTPGQDYQVYDRSGRVVGGSATRRLVPTPDVVRAAGGARVHRDSGGLLPTSRAPYRAVASRVRTADGRVVVVAAALNRGDHDEALRELLVQLLIVDLVTLVAASLVGYATARGALNPVERYRRAAAAADEPTLLPVAASRDDEITRLGHTFNALLERIAEGGARERRFLADASHELRSPLALMRTELEVLLLRPGGQERDRVALESLRDQVERLIALADALLALEEVRATGALDVEPVRLGHLASVVADAYAAEAAGAGRRIEVRVRGDAEVRANRHWLEMALGNLVANALRHGQGTVHVEDARSGALLGLAVRDEGPGFPPDFVDRAFDRFARADPSRTTRGTGLGLALVREVAEAHGGRASVAGSRVTLLLPTAP